VSYLAIKVVSAEEAVGKVLAYDVTYVTWDFMTTPLKKGDIIKDEDVELLKRAGHYYVFVYEGSGDESGRIYEDEAVLKLAELVAGEGTAVHARRGGKALIRSTVNGVLLVDEENLTLINVGGDFALITRKPGISVSVGEAVAIVDLIPFFVRTETIDTIRRELRGKKVINVKAFKNLRFGIIVTGTEIYEGKVKDLASPIVREKIIKYGGSVVKKKVLPDNKELIKEELLKMLNVLDGVVLTGGMSVDPTDVTHEAISEVADEVIAYGIPVKPTTMSMMAYWRGKPVIGVSSGIIFFREWNILDILLPKVMAGVKWRKKEITRLGLGGLHDVYLRRLGI